MLVQIPVGPFILFFFFITFFSSFFSKKILQKKLHANRRNVQRKREKFKNREKHEVLKNETGGAKRYFDFLLEFKRLLKG